MSPTGNLYASTLVRLGPGDPPATGLALVAGVALAETVHSLLPGQSGPTPSDRHADGAGPSSCGQARRGVALKWPNDVLVARAKIGGILLERSDAAVVAGFGVNVAHHPEALDRPATSLAAHGLAIAPDAVLAALDRSFRRHLGIWRDEGLAPLIRTWLAYADPPSTRMIARLPDGTTQEGFFDGLDGGGALLLRLASGERRVIHAADVFTL